MKKNIFFDESYISRNPAPAPEKFAQDHWRRGKKKQGKGLKIKIIYPGKYHLQTAAN